MYCLDSSFLINGWHKRYSPDVHNFSEIWETISRLVKDDEVVIPWEVAKEVKRQRDDLVAWLGPLRSFIKRPTVVDQRCLSELMKRLPNLAARGERRNAADPWVIATAQARNAIVVTDEERQKIATKPTKAPKIPHACDLVGVTWMPPIDFLGEIMGRSD